MASGFLRQGLRDEEVHKIVRRMRTLVSEGVGPDEAWANATGMITGVDPASFEGWKKHIFEQVQAAGPLDPTATRTNIYTRTIELSEELAQTKRKLGEMAARCEALTKQSNEADLAALKADLARLTTENEQLKELLPTPAKKAGK